jgi:hypothetical protein
MTGPDLSAVLLAEAVSLTVSRYTFQRLQWHLVAQQTCEDRNAYSRHGGSPQVTQQPNLGKTMPKSGCIVHCTHDLRSALYNRSI